MTQCPKCETPFPPEASYCLECGSSLELREGTMLHGYQIERFLGGGAVGEVWRATHPTTRKRAAVKVLRQDLFHNVTSPKARHALLTRFTREAQAVNQIETQKQHFVEIFSSGELADGRPFLMMDYLQGEELAGYLQRLGPLPFSKVLELTAQLCRALNAAHHHEPPIIHRDLKPQNIFLLEEGRGTQLVKILDFGLAKLSDEHSITRTGSRMGTPLYMSPEQCHSAKHVDLRTDLYSLGVIVYEMLTGRTPFGKQKNTQADIISILEQHISAQPPAMSSCVDGRAIPEQAEAVVARALAKDPAQRFDDCAAFFDAFEAAAAPLRLETFDAVKGARPNYDNEALLLATEPEPEAAPLLGGLPQTSRVGWLPLLLAGLGLLGLALLLLR